MKIAIVDSRSLTTCEIEKYVQKGDEIISGGAVGIDRCAAEYATRNSIKLTELIPNYAKYGKAAPIIRNKNIVDMADKLIIFWDGESKGTSSVIKYAKSIGKEHVIVICKKNE